MTPFDLQRARAGEPICTASGEPAKFGSYRSDAMKYGCVSAMINDICHYFNSDGKHDSWFAFDLMMADAPQPAIVHEEVQLTSEGAEILGGILSNPNSPLGRPVGSRRTVKQDADLPAPAPAGLHSRAAAESMAA